MSLDDLTASLQLIGERQTQSAGVGAITHAGGHGRQLSLAGKPGEMRELMNRLLISIYLSCICPRAL